MNRSEQDMPLVLVLLSILLYCTASACIVKRAAYPAMPLALTGRVVQQDGRPAIGVFLTLKLQTCKCDDCKDKKLCNCCPDTLAVITDNNGFFSFIATSGTYSLIVKPEGQPELAYQNIELTSKKSFNMLIRLPA